MQDVMRMDPEVPAVRSEPSLDWLPLTLGVSGFALIAVLSIALVAARSGR